MGKGQGTKSRRSLEKASTLQSRVWNPIKSGVTAAYEAVEDKIWTRETAKEDEVKDPEMEELGLIIAKMHRYRRVLSTLLILSTIFVYSVHPDWWIYGVITLSSGLVNLAYWPNLTVWRFATSTIIVFGVLESLFLVSTFQYLQDVPMLDSEFHVFKAVPEGMCMAIVAGATMLSIACRVFSAKYDTFLHFIRTLLLGTMLMFCFYVWTHGALYFSGLLPTPVVDLFYGRRDAVALFRDDAPTEPFARSEL